MVEKLVFFHLLSQMFENVAEAVYMSLRRSCIFILENFKLDLLIFGLYFGVYCLLYNLLIAQVENLTAFSIRKFTASFIITI